MKGIRASALGAILAASGPVASADIQYTVTDLGTLGGTYSEAAAINDAGQVVGTASIGFDASHIVEFPHAFVWSPSGGMTDLGTLGGPSSRAYAINDSGQVVGGARTSNPQNTSDHAFLRFPNGTMTDLGTLGGNFSRAYGINNTGHVAGQAADTFDNYAFYRPVGDDMTNLGTLGGGPSVAYGINRTGEVVGTAYSVVTRFDTRAFVCLPGNPMVELANPGGGNSEAYGISDHGQVVGYSGGHAVRWSPGGIVRDLGTLGGGSSTAYGVNNGGQVVGSSSTGSSLHAFVSDGQSIQDLNSLIDSTRGWVLKEARDINNVGQIVGTGTIGGKQHAFLLTPTAPAATPKVYGVFAGGTGGSVRGDLDAAAVRNAFLRFSGVAAENLALADSAQDVRDAIDDIKEKIRPQDSLIVFYSGHGGYLKDITQPEPVVPNSMLAAIHDFQLTNDGDERIVFSRTDYGITDDDLASMLRDERLTPVKKTVILDSCYSGGFWGSLGNGSDEGDLDKLANIALLAACGEGELARAELLTGRGRLSNALVAAIDAMLSDGGGLTLANLTAHLAPLYHQLESESNGLVMGFPGLQDDLVIPFDDASLFDASTADYDRSALMLPEPCTLPWVAVMLCLRRRKLRR